MLTAQINRTVSLAGRTIGKTGQNISIGSAKQIDESIAAGATNAEVGFSLDVSAVKVLALLASADLTVKTNDGTSPDNTFVLEADRPYIWTVEDGGTLRDTSGVAITTDITKLLVTNAGAAAATLQINAGLDPTP